jgi:hypothetical protein
MKGHSLIKSIFQKNSLHSTVNESFSKFLDIARPNMKRIFLTLLTAVTTFFAANAQLAEPVKWSFEAQKVGSNAYQVKITANIEEGWYVYPQQLEKPGPIPTQIKFESNPNVVLSGKTVEVGDRKEDYDQNFDMKVVKLVHKAEFIQNVKTTGSIEDLKGQLTFMTCNGEMCMPPKNVDFKVKLD